MSVAFVLFVFCFGAGWGAVITRLLIAHRTTDRLLAQAKERAQTVVEAATVADATPPPVTSPYRTSEGETRAPDAFDEIAANLRHLAEMPRLEDVQYMSDYVLWGDSGCHGKSPEGSTFNVMRRCLPALTAIVGPERIKAERQREIETLTERLNALKAM